jgi:hypothetical protein
MHHISSIWLANNTIQVPNSGRIMTGSYVEYDNECRHSLLHTGLGLGFIEQMQISSYLRVDLNAVMAEKVLPLKL